VTGTEKSEPRATVMPAAATTARRARLEPLTHVGIEADTVHVVCKGPCAAAAQEVMVRAYGVVELDVVTCKRDFLWRAQCVMPYSLGCRPIGECAVTAKRCQYADWMQPAAKS